MATQTEVYTISVEVCLNAKLTVLLVVVAAVGVLELFIFEILNDDDLWTVLNHPLI